MNLLAVDTSSGNLSFGIMVKDKIVLSFDRRIKFGASKLLTYLDSYCKSTPLDLKRIDAFVIGSGPGSFTGLRVSFSVIKALSISLNKPIISIGSFFSCAYPFVDRQEKIAVITDARRSLIYASSFLVKSGKLKKEEKEKLTSLEKFIKEKGKYFFITYDENIRRLALKVNPEINFYSKDVYPRAKNLLLLAKEYYNKEKFTLVSKLEPLYIHPKTCQIRIKAK